MGFFSKQLKGFIISLSKIRLQKSNLSFSWGGKSFEKKKKGIWCDCFETSAAYSNTGTWKRWLEAIWMSGICICIYTSEDIPVEFEETPDSVYEKVGEFLRESCQDVPLSSSDRAHHIGSEYKSYRNKKKCCNIIDCFMSFRHQTLF